MENVTRNGAAACGRALPRAARGNPALDLGRTARRFRESQYRHGRHSYLLNPGDTLTFHGDAAHGPERLDKIPIRMLSLIIYAREED